MKSLLTKLAEEVDKKEKKPPFGGGKEEKPEAKKENKPEGGGNPFAKKEDKPKEPGAAPEKPSEEAPPMDGATPAEGEAPAEGSPPAEGIPEVGALPAKQVGVSAVMDFMMKYPNGGADLHAMAQQEGIDPTELDQSMYALAMKTVNLLRGGYMNQAGVDMATIDQNELTAGTQMEMKKHTPDESIAKKIALDNLTEVPDYYTRLKGMVEGSVADSNAAIIPKKDGAPDEDLNDEKPNDAPWNTPSSEG